MAPRILTIPPGLPFLPTLARGILSGRVVPGFALGDDPLALADVTVFVPTRRAALSLTAAFAHAIGGEAAILPRIRPLSERDEADAFTGAPDGAAALTRTVDPLRRRLELARLVRFWKSRVEAGAASALAGREIVLPASAADALWLAGDLGTLLDEAGDEEIDLSALAKLDVEDRLAEWWQLTLAFLAILTQEWPRHLEETGFTEAAAARNLWAREAAGRYRREGSRGPVVIAGSTAAAPATLELMRAVADLENGALVLPGLDTDLDAPSFAAIDRAASAAAAGHPQYGLRRVLAGLGATREDVEAFAPEIPALAARQRFLSNALRPAETTDLWASGAEHPAQALDGLALVEAADEGEEARAIAVAMRDALSDPQARVALTTPDRKLARRVVVELSRFGIAANDSAGRPLHATAPGTLARLALEAALSPGDPVTLVSLLKHPLTRLGLGAAEARRAARTVEMIGLRGGSGRAGAETLAVLYAERRAALAKGGRVARPVHLLGEKDRDLGERAAAALAEALSPLTALRRAPAQEIAPLALALTQALEALARDETGSFAPLYAEEAGAALSALLSELIAAPEVGFAVEPAEWPDVFAALGAGAAARPRAGLSQRAFVWGALEARLQNVDVMIVGGLNEGTWPQGARSDAFLSRLMRAEILLDPPERRIGLAAHDIWMALGSPRVVMTRAKRAEGAPSIPSRWLQRILALAGEDGAQRLRDAGVPFLEAARSLDDAAAEPRASRPEPRPPLERRPRQFSVTEVERLVRDPYAVHAKRILHLEPMDPLIRAPGVTERGTLFHDILAAFTREVPDPQVPDAHERLIAIAREAFAREALPPEIAAVWWPRMEGLATRFLEWEHARSPRVRRRHAESRGRLDVSDIAVTLTGYADRIDEMGDGRLEIFDYKTGTQPSAKQARTLLAPQLPLEAAMAREGGFKGIAAAPVGELSYVRLRENEVREDRLSQSATPTREAVSAEGLADEALARFRALAAASLDPGRGYRSRARPALSGDFSGPYDHLARAREWSIGDDEDGASGEDA
ncbi:double-strand break repair protein AddB [Aureimonas mangrovi]|uniref:double-strand break repair protein AddB n=1 Tax=Aureimonas mangrovi TaxID=2758041 RepID=UPI00163DCC9E|nr:double-strand break repair protein AddB [Aureimonas mangrovi]